MDRKPSPLRQRLLDAQNDFLAARDSAAVEEFSTGWLLLCEDFDRAMAAGAVDDDLIAVAYSVAFKVAALADSLFQLQQASNPDHLLIEVETLLAQMSIDDVREDNLASAASTSRTFSSDTPLPGYIGVAFQWLQHHIWDPYPPTQLKRSLAKEARVSYRTVDDWFKTIRRHIGWVSLCKRHFHGSRSLAIAAARAAFLVDRDSPSLPSTIVSEFHAVKTSLENLYLTERRFDFVPTRTEQKLHIIYPDVASDCSYVPPSPSVKVQATEQEPYSPSSPTINIFNYPRHTHSSPPSRSPSLVFSTSDSEDEDTLSDWSPPHVSDAGWTGLEDKTPVSDDQTRISKRDRW